MKHKRLKGGSAATAIAFFSSALLDAGKVTTAERVYGGRFTQSRQTNLIGQPENGSRFAQTRRINLIGQSVNGGRNQSIDA